MTVSSALPDALICLRVYRPSDLVPILRLDRLCFDEAFRFSHRAMRQFAEAPNALALIAETAAAEISGFLIVHIERAEEQTVGYVVTLDVHPNFVRAGIATRLLHEGERLAANLGATSIQLHVHSQNSSAISFYRIREYEYIRTHPDFYSAGLHADLYEKRLPTALEIDRG